MNRMYIMLCSEHPLWNKPHQQTNKKSLNIILPLNAINPTKTDIFFFTYLTYLSTLIAQTTRCIVQNLLNREWLRYSGVFLAWIRFHLYGVFIWFKCRIISFKSFSNYKILVKYLDSWLVYYLKVTIFQGLLLQRQAIAVI